MIIVGNVLGDAIAIVAARLRCVCVPIFSWKINAKIVKNIELIMLTTFSLVIDLR